MILFQNADKIGLKEEAWVYVVFKTREGVYLKREAQPSILDMIKREFECFE